jgi:signal transduction histidine kinase/CheY-like chemotaxis protein
VLYATTERCFYERTREALGTLTGADCVHICAWSTPDQPEKIVPDDAALFAVVHVATVDTMVANHAKAGAPEGSIEALLYTRSQASLWRVVLAVCAPMRAVALLTFNARTELDEEMRDGLEAFAPAAGALLYAAETKARAQRERVEFIARVNHELRTPLHGVLGFAALCLREPLPALLRDQIRSIQRSGEALRDTLDSVVDLRRLDADEVIFERAPLSLDALLHAVVNDHRGEAARKGLTLTRTPVEGGPCTVYADKMRLQQMLGHLVANGLRFTERGGVVVSVSTKLDGSRVRTSLAVTDTGPGIAPHDLARMFAPFEQGQRFSTRSHGGLGVGLALVARLATRMGGHVSVDTTPGSGSCFRVELMFERAPEVIPRVDTRPAVLALREPSRLRVLVVEDNPVNQMLAVALLHREGHSVHVAANGRLAFDAMRDGVFDVVLMDIQMPEMDGYETTARIRTLDASRGVHTPIIAMTAHGLADDRHRCLAAGMDDFVGKPIDWPALRALLVRWSRHATGAPRIDSTRVSSPGVVATAADLDVASLRARVNGRHDVLQRLVTVYREQYPVQLAMLREAVTRGSASEARRLAHRLIGTVGCFSAETAAREARAVEQAATLGDLCEAARRTDILAREMQRLDESLTQVIREVSHAIAG